MKVIVLVKIQTVSLTRIVQRTVTAVWKGMLITADMADATDVVRVVCERKVGIVLNLQDVTLGWNFSPH